jgi:hypothetical protein
MASVPDSARRTPDSASRPRKALTIGAVCKILQGEFDDVSISKIRYLEDQKLLNPRRTSGGYRLYSQSDVERLRTILRLQRDEFLPLRVIRQELAAGNDMGFGGAGGDGGERKPTPGAVRRAILVDTSRTYLSLEEVLDATGKPSTTRPIARSSVPPTNCHGSGSGRATCASSVPPPTASPSSWKRCWGRHCARATRSGAKRHCRAWKASPRPSAT